MAFYRRRQSEYAAPIEHQSHKFDSTISFSFGRLSSSLMVKVAIWWLERNTLVMDEHSCMFSCERSKLTLISSVKYRAIKLRLQNKCSLGFTSFGPFDATLRSTV